MKEESLVGKWRSYKVFCHSGKIEKHSFSNFIELMISDSKELSLRYTYGRQNKINLKPGNWQLQEIKKHCFLFFGKKQAFEILTLEDNNLVVHDHVKGEKIFFTQLPEWNDCVVREAPSHTVIPSSSTTINH